MASVTVRFIIISNTVYHICAKLQEMFSGYYPLDNSLMYGFGEIQQKEKKQAPQR